MRPGPRVLERDCVRSADSRTQASRPGLSATLPGALAQLQAGGVGGQHCHCPLALQRKRVARLGTAAGAAACTGRGASWDVRLGYAWGLERRVLVR